VAELAAIGIGPHDRWQKPLSPGEMVRLGRAPRRGFKVPWDKQISREHAELTWNDGSLFVKCLDTARNSIYYIDQPTKEFSIRSGDAFRIGGTWFVLSEPVDRTVGFEMLEERAFDRDELNQIAFSNPTRVLDLTARLPELIAKSRTDEDFAMGLAALLLGALPRVQVAAVVFYADLASVESSQPTMIRWESRSKLADHFQPSRKMIANALIQGKSLLQIWTAGGSFNSKFTQTWNLDWAICTPIASDACRGWCLYLCGESSEGITADDLKGDLKFVEMMAQFIGSIRKVRQLEQLHANMSQFFSANVLETLTAESADVLLKPRESDITVIFCDVRGFSKMTEKSNSDLFFLLGRVIEALSVMTRGIVKYDGIIADFQGDAALGFWGWPVTLVDGPIPACQAALAIQSWFSEASVTRNHPLTDFRVGIGIAHGRAIAGRIGSDEQAKIGVFGPPVNLGSRLEELTKHLQVPILIDESTAELVRSSMPSAEGRCRRLGQFRPYGLETSLIVSELLPPAEQYPAVCDQHILDFEAAVESLIAGDWRRAIELMTGLPETDGPRRFLLNYMAQHGNAPPENWDGVIPLSQK
jgi:adenylate cyclase